MVGNSVKSRAVTYDLISRFRGLLGGELPAYTELLSSASAEATSRLMEEAEMLGAGAVVRVRYQTSATADPASGIYCYVMCYVRACALLLLLPLFLRAQAIAGCLRLWQGTAVRCEGDPEPVAPVATDPTANTSATSSVE